MTPPRRRAVLALLPALAGCAVAVVPAGEFDAAAAAEMARRPEFYVNGEARAFLVRRGGAARGLLWGTWHVGYDEATLLPRPVRTWFARSSRLLVEQELDRVDRDTRLALEVAAARGVHGADPRAVAGLGERVRAALAAAGVTRVELGEYSLLGLSLLVSSEASAPLASALPAAAGVDGALIGFARSIGMNVEGLEQPDPERMRRLLYPDPNGAGAAAALRLALRRRAGARDFLQWMRARYRAGQVGVLQAGIAGWRAEAADLRRVDAMRGELLAERNRAWLPRLEQGLGGAGQAFVAFGAAHLTGVDGVVALLRERGWEVAACVGDAVPA